MAGRRKKVVVPTERYEVRTAAALTKEITTSRLEDREEMVESLPKTMSDAAAVVSSTRRLNDDDVDMLTAAYIDATNVETLGKVLKDEIKNRVLKDLEAKDVLEIDSRRYETYFSKSKPNRVVTFDIEGLKRDHPEIVQMVLSRTGKPLPAKERRLVDEQADTLRLRIADLQKQLAMLNSKIAADDKAHEEKIDEELLDRLISANPELEQFRTVQVSSSRFYFKTRKPEEDQK